MDEEEAEEQERKERRQHLVLAEQESHASYDRAILALAGGGLGLSIAFIKDVPTKDGAPFSLLFLCWMCWAASITSTLFSFYTSQKALAGRIKELDKRQDETGGFAAKATRCLNAFSGLTFLAGMALIVMFVSQSMGGSMSEDKKAPVPVPGERVKKGYPGPPSTPKVTPKIIPAPSKPSGGK